MPKNHDWDLTEEVAQAVESALAGRSLEVTSGSEKSSSADLVTEIDLALEADLRESLTHLLPGSSFLGEEGGGELGDGPTWVVDPVDGTTNVVHGYPVAAVGVALWSEGEVVLAAVRDLFRGLSVTAIRGEGIRSSTDDTVFEVSEVGDLSAALIGIGLPYDRSEADEMFGVAREIFERCQDLRRGGSAILDILDVAMGRLDAHVEIDLRPWDVMAAGLILEESGGRLTDWSGGEIIWTGASDTKRVLASNGSLHDEIAAITSPS